MSKALIKVLAVGGEHESVAAAGAGFDTETKLLQPIPNLTPSPLSCDSIEMATLAAAPRNTDIWATALNRLKRMLTGDQARRVLCAGNAAAGGEDRIGKSPSPERQVELGAVAAGDDNSWDRERCAKSIIVLMISSRGEIMGCCDM